MPPTCLLPSLPPCLPRASLPAFLLPYLPVCLLACLPDRARLPIIPPPPRLSSSCRNRDTPNAAAYHQSWKTRKNDTKAEKAVVSPSPRLPPHRRQPITNPAFQPNGIVVIPLAATLLLTSATALHMYAHISVLHIHRFDGRTPSSSSSEWDCSSGSLSGSSTT
eukprot:GHVU01143035.1.p1 GENE.GHVU01143035.1~~GHVU01143035.1.p1  ORF type:complete len:164 (-),score=17.37 GHVU01143035.1:527-1018(-)